jgi:prepilin-type processing-associated H-X9-DG protein
MNEHLVGYLLDSLDDATRRQVESYLQTHPDARADLTRLRKALEPLEADREDAAPPSDLVMRTLGRVAEHVCRDNLPKAPLTVPTEVLPYRPWYRRVDMLVAACLLLTVLGAGLPVLFQLRSQSSHAVMIACQDNLRQFYGALAVYRDTHGRYPDVTAESPRNVAGLIVPALADANVLPKNFSVRCPAIGPHLGCQITLVNLRNMSEDEFAVHAPALSLCYAYSLGYRDDEGYHGPGQSPLASSSWPILADRPPSEASPGNSINHGGAGQNVLFLDGHVRFASGRNLSGFDDDIFLNHEQRVAAGVGPRDVVLGYSSSRP